MTHAIGIDEAFAEKVLRAKGLNCEIAQSEQSKPPRSDQVPGAIAVVCTDGRAFLIGVAKDGSGLFVGRYNPTTKTFEVK